MGYYDVFFDGSNVGKLVFSLLYESLERNDGTLPDLYDICRYVDYGVIRGVVISIG